MSDPKKLLDTVLTLVKDRYENDSTQAPPMVFACQDDEIVAVIELDFTDQDAKDLSIAMAGMFLKQHPFDASIHVSEAWMSVVAADQMNGDSFTPPSESPDRVEVLICEVSSKEQHLSVVQKMNRGESGNIIDFAELYRSDSLDNSSHVIAQSKFDFFGGASRKVN